MLSGILKLLREREQLSLREISIHFQMDVSALEPMMDVLVGKGKVEVLSAECTNGSCSGCSCSSRENTMVYTAVNNETNK